jgi:hypothetical protein
MEPLLFQILNPRDGRAIVFLQELVEVIGVPFALTEQRA